MDARASTQAVAERLAAVGYVGGSGAAPVATGVDPKERNAIANSLHGVPDVITELAAAIALEPRHFRANLLLGRLLTLRGDAASAIPYLRTAMDVEPASADAKAFLADAIKRKP